MEQEVIHIPELAKMLGRTESSIRSARQEGASWLPPFFKQGVRICWRVATVRKFLEEYEQGMHMPAKPGRKRNAPPTLASVR
ncbi:hypothetical protein [Pseudomonas sichuanensis]|uniref:hypothetical protein n=1 Tax=Pseudomonas sichuanensis TaxID=2213015 RepID=UPI000DA6B383|nr:hypothetical protein [Pseudomonas sichuanensis]